MKKIIIAIDGHSACGKSTLARELAEKLKYKYISTGSMYRAVTIYFLKEKIDISNKNEIKEALKNIKLNFKIIDSENHIFLNNKDIQSNLNNTEVANFVSQVSAIPAIRKFLVKQQRKIGKHKGIVMDGRDIGTVVFPNAELKIFLTANTDERAKRRHDELIKQGKKANFEDVKNNLTQRDHIDSTRKDSPLKQATDALLLDNTNLTKKEQLEIALKWVDDVLPHKTQK